MGLQPVRGVERVIPAPVTGEDVRVHLLIAGVDPALDGARVHVWGKAKRLVPGLPPAHPVGIGALPVGIENAFVFPQAIEKRTRLGESRVLPRHDLRLGPVDVEDLRLPCLQRGEVLVEAPFLDFPFFVAVRLEILADFREPVARKIGGEHAANHRTPGASESTGELPPGPCHPVCRRYSSSGTTGRPQRPLLRMLSAARLTWSFTSA